MTDRPSPPFPPEEPSDLPSDEPRGFSSSDAVSWARRDLSADGGRRALGLLGRALGGVRVFGLFVMALGILAAIVTVALHHGRPLVLIILLVLCLPAIAGPFVARRHIGNIRSSLDRPDEVVAQARSLISNLRDTSELRDLASRVSRKGAAGSGGRIRRTIANARLASNVLEQVGPTPEAQPLLVPFLPERLGTMWSSIGWTWWGLLLAPAVIVIAIIAAVIAA